MKHIKQIFCAFALLLLPLTSCEEYLDIAPDEAIYEADVYETYITAQAYLDNCYKALFDYQGINTGGLGAHQFEAITDNACTTAPGTNFINGNWYGNEYMMEVGYASSNLGSSKGFAISNSSYCIRIANNLLENIASIPSIGATDDEKDWLMGQAYFFRAWYYFEWIRRLGGMQDVSKAYTSADELDLPRLSYQECSEQIIEDLGQAIALLPDEWNDENQGRAEKCSAHALRGMVALYAASPLMQNPIGQTVERDDYDLEWAKDAATYCAATLDYLDANRPEKNMEGEGLTGEEWDAAYSDIFYHKTSMSKETLWSKNHSIQKSAGATADGREVDLHVHYLTTPITARAGSWGWNVTMPSQNLVDAYEMADGTTFSWDNPEHSANPYDNRDPRFYRSVVYPGNQHSYNGSSIKGDFETFSADRVFADTFYLETWTTSSALGNKYGIDMSFNSWNKNIPSGYLCKKWWWEDAYGRSATNEGGYGVYMYNSVFIRTAQVWLDLAEALNEVAGPTGTFDGYTGPTALEAVNKVRRRAGMPDIVTTDASELRERIRNERRIELAFEYHRWFDIRRWMLFDDLFTTDYPINGIAAVVEDVNGTLDQEQWDYSYSTIEIKTAPRNFETKHYWYPIPQNITDQLYNTQQNYGW